MSLPPAVAKQLEKLIQQNVNKFFGTLKPAERTADKVQAFAQNQLDFFISGIVKESPDLRMKWVKGHPYHAHLRIQPNSNLFEVEVTCDE
jgi:hypothetical protein